MEIEILDQTHPDFAAEHWRELDALAKGGKRFHDIVERFLPRNPMEPDAHYQIRKKAAKYHSYSGSIINLYTAWLFAAGFNAKAFDATTGKAAESPDSWYATFQNNVGARTSLRSFMKERFRTAMTCGKAVWLAELPPAPEDVDVTDRATYDKLHLGDAQLVAVDPAELLDWEKDDDGQLVWAVLKRTWTERASWAKKRNTVVEQWRVYERAEVATFELRYEVGRRPAVTTDVPEKSRTIHGFDRVPLILLCIPEEMCIGEQTKDPQTSHFQLDNALGFAIRKTCYAMPVWKVEDTEPDKLPTLGVGYAQFIGKDEELTWASPPSDAFDVIARNRDSKRDEIFRIVHQMAQGIDNNAETVGRSADSKEIDAAATRIMLNAYGELIGEAIQETLALVSAAREDSYTWSIEGFSGYETATVASLLANVGAAKKLGVPSKTFLREITKKGALALVPELAPNMKEQIRSEIEDYDFEVTGEVLELQIQDELLESQEEQQDKSLKAQAKNAKLAAKAKANQPKPAPAPAQKPKR